MDRNTMALDLFIQTVRFEEIARYAKPGYRLPVYQIMQADFLTPTMAYLRLRHSGKASFLLESVIKGRQMGRYSFLGHNPVDLLVQSHASESASSPDFFNRLQQKLDEKPLIHLPGLPRFNGGAVGYIGFDMIRQIECIPAPKPDAIGIPDALMAFYNELIAFDHVKSQVYLIRLIDIDNLSSLQAQYDKAVNQLNQLQEKLLDERPLHLRPFEAKNETLQSNQSKEQFEQSVRTVIKHIYAGDIFQAVLSQRFSMEYSGDVFQVYRALRSINPSPYMFFMDFDTFQFLGTSPEPLVRLEQNRLEIIPIAGTRQRGQSEAEDIALEQDLINDPKERAEHIMLVDLARNDLGRVSRPGSVKVHDLFTIERYSHVMHLISRVTGELKEQAKAVDAFKAAFPAGTVSGAPKIRAMEIINDLEPHKRSFYAGAAGYFDYSGNMDTCIAIRSMLAQNGILYWQAGAGIVADSISEKEYQETINKGKALLKAIQKASRGKS